MRGQWFDLDVAACGHRQLHRDAADGRRTCQTSVIARRKLAAAVVRYCVDTRPADFWFSGTPVQGGIDYRAGTKGARSVLLNGTNCR